MDSKNYTDVLINGKIYTLGGAEEESYLQQVASYINEKMTRLQRQPGFMRQSEDYRAVMTFLNLADDYFKEKQYAARAAAENQELEKETYSLKHELVSTQMKLEASAREAEELREQVRGLRMRLDSLEKEREQAKTGSGSSQADAEDKPGADRDRGMEAAPGASE